MALALNRLDAAKLRGDGSLKATSPEVTTILLSVTIFRMGDADQQSDPFADACATQGCDTVFGDHEVHVVAG